MSYTPLSDLSDGNVVPQHPKVTLVPPPDDLDTSHHGPTSTGISLTDGSVKPKYFQNPWKSWRQPSLSDAYTAYSKGAAIALPLHRTARKVKRAVEEVEEDFDEWIENDVDPRGSDGAIRETKLVPIPSRTYIRPEFSVVHEEDEESDWSDPPLEVVSPQWDNEDKVDVTWLGHASTLVRIPWRQKGGISRKDGSCGILFDPIFSYRCSPSQYVGPARYLDPPCTVAELPPIHICCISHDHYDHLDYYTIVDLWKHHSSTIHFFVGFGLAQWFISSGIPEDRVTELDWWHETILSFSPSTNVEDRANGVYPTARKGDSVDQDAALNLKLVFTPAQHRTGRGLRDHMTTLWGSWCIGVIEDEDAKRAIDRGMNGWKGFKMYFGGDTGYRYATAPEDDPDAVCPAFQQIADLYGPMTLSMLPLSTGSSLPFLRTVLSLSLDQYTLTSSQHCSPGDALELHRIMNSVRTLGIHWGTFCDSDEARGTRIEFGRERRRRQVSGLWEGGDEGADDKGRFVTSDIGQTLVWP